MQTYQFPTQRTKLKNFIEWKISSIIGFYVWEIYRVFTLASSMQVKWEKCFPLEFVPKNKSVEKRIKV